MGKVNVLIHSFNRGEVSTAALARVDQEKMRLAAEVQENIFPYTIGKGLFRPGTEYLGTSRSNAKARGIPFVKRLSDTAVVEMVAGYMRVWLDDELITRPSVTTTIGDGDFSGSASWTLEATNATATISGGILTLAAPARGTSALAKQQVSLGVGAANTEHALRITVTSGPVIFECGSSDGGDEYITRSELDTGIHSLAFTPTAAFWVRFTTRREYEAKVDSITIESSGTMEIAAPWTEDEMWEISKDQSADVIFLAHENWQTQRIERRGTRSWSLVDFKADDGPFALSSTLDRNIKLTPGAAFGSTTLSANGPVFKESDIGSLYRVEAAGHNAMFKLAGDGVYTEAVRVTGITPDNAVAVLRAGTWSGTLRLQRSHDGPDTGFVDVSGTTYTTNGTTTTTPASTYNNVIHWFRVGFNAGDYVSGVVEVTITAGSGGDGGVAASASGGNPGIYRVTAYTNSQLVNVDVLDYPSSLTASEHWRRGEWSDRRGWPSALTFHDGRLYFSAFDRFAGSVSDAYTSFSLDTEGDSAPVIRSIATSGMVPRCNSMVSLQRLLFLTEGSETSARSSNFDAPMTATDITLRDAGTVGAGTGPAVKIDKHAVYIDNSQTNLQKIFYDFNSQDYETQPIAELNEDYGGDGIITLAIQRARRQPYVWAVREDGECAVILYKPNQEVEAVVSFITDGIVEDVCVVRTVTEDRVYLFVKRTINGSTVRYFEKHCLHSEATGGTTTKLADAGVYAAGPVTSVTATHLASETGLIGWGVTSGGVKTVLEGLSANGSGVVALGGTYSNVWVGLPYSGRYQSAKLAYGAQGGTALMQEKRVQQVGLLLANTHRNALKVGRSFSALSDYTLKSDSEAALSDANVIKSSNDTLPQPFGGNWNTDSRVCITIEPGHPATLLGLMLAIETSEK